MLTFRSLRSGSSGNVLLLESRRGRSRTRLLIDCGISSQRGCLKILEEEVGLADRIDGLLVTHAHSDHVNYSTLRVMQELGVPLFVHTKTQREIQKRYMSPHRTPASVDFSRLETHTFDDAPFSLGDFEVTPIPVPHAPGVTTHAFAISQGRRRVVIASDFHDPDAVVPHIYDADLIYVESNHDAGLLRQHFNPASLFHLPNSAAGLLIQHALLESRRLPQAVVLAHLSEERNRPHLALRTVRQILEEAGLADEVSLVTAPRYAATDEWVIDG